MTTRKRRSRWMRDLGLKVHPETVADAWYAADCPPRFDPRKHGVSQGDWLRWQAGKFLRGCRT